MLLHMPNEDLPYEKLEFFQDRIGASPGELKKLKPYGPLFIARKQELAEDLYRFFLSIPETRLILEGLRDEARMKATWAAWFEALFKSRGERAFLSYLWQIGARHVEIDLDQRFTNLGFARIRQFCQEIVNNHVPEPDRAEIGAIIHKLIDLCLLVETSAYVQQATKCDFEVIRDIADRVRNPATVIGGNVKRLLKKAGKETKEAKIYETLITENQRLENMVFDIKTYMTLFQMEPVFQVVQLNDLIKGVLKRLKGTGKFDDVAVNVELDPSFPFVKGDPRGLTCLFHYLLQNAMEAAGKREPMVRVTSRAEEGRIPDLRIEIFNTGSPPRKDQVGRLFSPFYSTKLSGTGFGLPIAHLVVRRHHGKLNLEPVEGEGTRAVVTLPVPE
jgi:signal transduction histidine kinase